MEDTVQRMAPVMETLEHMHKDNVIHRDISPDNIMVVEDGSLKLLDFGAAKQYSDSTLSRLVVKASYSPPEQMDARGMFGSWSDVYSICAAIYFCITGKNPEDAISRLMIDDLKRPSELGADILPAAEKTLMRGMALDSSERIRDMALLRAGLEKVYPILTYEEQKELERKKKHRSRIITAALLTAVLLIAVITYANRIRILFSFTDTETFLLDRSDLTDEEYDKNADIVESRVDALTGGRYLMKKNEDIVKFEVPEKMFGGNRKRDLIWNYITNPLKLYFALFDSENGEYQVVDILDQEKDIKAVYEKNGTFYVEYTETAQDRLKEYLGQEGLSVWLSFDILQKENPHFEGVCTGDGKTMELTAVASPGDAGVFSGNYVCRVMTEAPLSSPFNADTVIDAVWEDPDDISDPGKYQVREKDILKGSDAIRKWCFAYGISANEMDDDHDAPYDPATSQIIKDRLDALETPYALGREKGDSNYIVIEMPEGAITYEMMDLVCGKYERDDLSLGSMTRMETNTYGAMYDSTSEGHPYFEPFYSQMSESEKKNLRSFMESLKEDGEKYLYLQFCHFPIAKTEIDKALASFDASENIVFDEWCAEKGKEEQNARLAALVITAYNQSPKYTYYNEGFDKKTKNGEPCWKGDGGRTLAAEQRAWDYAEEWEKEKSHGLSFTHLIHKVGLLRCLHADYCNESTSEQKTEEWLERFCSFYRDNRDKLQDGTYNYMEFTYLSVGGRTFLQGGDIGEKPGIKAKIIIALDPDTGTYYIASIFGCDEKKIEEIKKYLQKDKVLSGMFTDVTEETLTYNTMAITNLHL